MDPHPFTKVEIDLLIDIMLKYKHIIENKRTDATTWKNKNEGKRLVLSLMLLREIFHTPRKQFIRNMTR